MPAEVIARVHVLARNAPAGITFADMNHIEYPDDDDFDYESDDDPDSDSDDEEDDDAPTEGVKHGYNLRSGVPKPPPDPLINNDTGQTIINNKKME